MKYWPFFLLFVSPTILAQEIKKLTETVIEVQNAYPSKEGAEIASDLEDKLDPDICPINGDQDEIDNKSSLPLNLKRSGWKVLFEVKYGNINKEETSHQKYKTWDGMTSSVEDYLKNRGQEIPTDLPTLNAVAAEMATGFGAPGIGPDVYRNIMILRTLEKTENPDQMYGAYKNAIKDMNTQDKLGLLTTIASYIPYDNERAAFFSEQNEHTRGKVSPFEITRSDTAGGVCGDIHSTVAKFAEIAGLEAFTIGYALTDGDFKTGGPQHVISAVVDPNDKDKVYIINYSTLQTNDLSEGQSLRLAPTNSMTGNGILYRIFKNSGDAETGKMQQIGVLPTSMRGFFDELTQKQYQLEKAMPQNQNFNQNKVSFIHEKEKIKERASTTMHKQVGEGMTIYQGTSQEGEIWGVAVSSDKYKKIYSNATGDLKKTKYFGATLSGSLLDNNPSASGPDMYYVYLKLTGAQIFHLIESPQFKFAGAVGYTFDAFASSDIESGNVTAADGNFETFAQVLAEYQKQNTNIKMAVKLDNTIALKDQNLMTDFSQYPSNVNFIKPNALSANIDLTQKIDSKTAITGSGSVLLTNMGNRVMLSTGIIKNQTSVNLSYSGGMGSAGLSGNHIKSVNLIQNTLGYDGLRLSAGQNFSNKNRTFSGTVGGYAGLSNAGQGYGGASLKINLGSGSKKKKYKPQ